MKVEKLIKFLKKNRINYFCGVPDSLLSSFSKKISHFKSNHILAVNEGSATAIGIGYYLSTKKIPCIYLQNSGLGNAINPLVSVSHKKVYSIPLFLLIGWRGSPKSNDEPQHLTKGLITRNLLKLLGIKYYILKKNDNLKNLSKLISYSKRASRPVACLVKKGVIESKKKNQTSYKLKGLSRPFFVEKLIKSINNKTKIISNTGFTSRELYQIRREKKARTGKDFYMVGGMGHSSSVALGVSLNSKEKTICLDGDGSLLMHFGSLFTCAFYSKSNFKYILLNNNCHESVGEQKTHSDSLDFKSISKGLGFKKYFFIDNENNLHSKISNFIKSRNSCFVEVKIKTGSLNNLSRPKNFSDIKKEFMKHS